MLIFLDEAGDTGFKLGEGSSEYFVVMLVLVPSSQIAEDLGHRIQNIRRELKWSKEFHFSKTPDKVRDTFLRTMASVATLRFRAIVVPKDKVYSEFLRDSDEGFYNYIVKLVLEHDGGRIRDAKLFIDKRGPKVWRHALASYLRRQLNSSQQRKILQVSQKDWKENSLVQLADMYCGALYRQINKGNSHFYQLIKAQEDDVWRFR
jgi:hypothetical protein